MKTRSRLAGLLLAVLMLLYASASATTVDANTYNSAVNGARAGVVDWLFESYAQQLADLAPSARYEKLQEWNNMGILTTLFSQGFIDYCSTNHAGEALVCVCDTLNAYGEVVHDADCEWYFGNLTTAEQQAIMAEKTEEEAAIMNEAVKDKGAPIIYCMDTVWSADTGSLTITCKALGADAYAWERGQTAADGTVAWTIVEGETANVIVIDAYTCTLGYVYRCMASNPKGSTASEAVATEDANSIINSEAFQQWIAEMNPTEAMIQMALLAGGVDKVYFDGSTLYSVYCGEVIATYDVETSQFIDVRYHIPVAWLDVETNAIYALVALN